MYVSPAVVASFDAEELLGEAYGGNLLFGHDGIKKTVGNGSSHGLD